MLRLMLTVYLTILFPATLYADTTIYACKKNGETTLENIQSKDCDSVETYHYPSFAKSGEKHVSDLRPGERQQLEMLDKGYLASEARMRRYENIDERVGWSLANSYVDSRQDKCAFFRAMLDGAVSYVAVKNEQDVEIGPYRSAELITRINHAQSQVNYYCP